MQVCAEATTGGRREQCLWGRHQKEVGGTSHASNHDTKPSSSDQTLLEGIVVSCHRGTNHPLLCRRLRTVRKEMPTSSWTGSRYMLVPTNIKEAINVFQPPVTTNYMVRPGQPPKLVEVISELGIFGYVIGLGEFPVSRICFVFQSFEIFHPQIFSRNKDKIITNKQVGFHFHIFFYPPTVRLCTVFSLISLQEKNLFQWRLRLGTCWGPSWATWTRVAWQQVANPLNPIQFTKSLFLNHEYWLTAGCRQNPRKFTSLTPQVWVHLTLCTSLTPRAAAPPSVEPGDDFWPKMA